MSFRTANGVPIIADQPDDVCELCGKVAECRPYGPNGENICFDCGMKDEKTTSKMMGKILFGEGESVATIVCSWFPNQRLPMHKDCADKVGMDMKAMDLPVGPLRTAWEESQKEVAP